MARRWKISGYHRRTIDPYRRRKSDITFSLITSVILRCEGMRGKGWWPPRFLSIVSTCASRNSHSIYLPSACLPRFCLAIRAWVADNVGSYLDAVGKLIMSQQIFVKYWHCAAFKFRKATRFFNQSYRNLQRPGNLDPLEIELCGKS